MFPLICVGVAGGGDGDDLVLIDCCTLASLHEVGGSQKIQILTTIVDLHMPWQILHLKFGEYILQLPEESKAITAICLAAA
jgi:hypothetical protein